ncbi:probable E3 ubiquitin-protein ligase MID2 [Morus notabilis]|uniref:probable E3 ubiquitin-protein ligase MID2 n=1 Tax=Morus notabilis TaxID=981085 RepID=UPI000CED3801|nr:probable E3 ubiquitin-protein ligase MID2 [Morus notabilis]
MAEKVINVRRETLEACMTCPLCNELFHEATALAPCLHTFCRKCIYEKLSDEKIKYCPVCHTDLGGHPVEKLRRDHNLQDICSKILPLKRRKIAEPEFTPSISLPVDGEEESPSSSPKVQTQIPPDDAKNVSWLIVYMRSFIPQTVVSISRAAGEAFASSPVFSHNLGVLEALASKPFPDQCSNVEETIDELIFPALHSLSSIRDAEAAKEEVDLLHILNFNLEFLSMVYYQSLIFCRARKQEQLLSQALKQLEEKDILVTSLHEKEELRGIVEQAQIKQAQAESALEETQILKEKAIADAVEEARKETRENLTKEFQNTLKMKQAEAEHALKEMQTMKEKASKKFGKRSGRT